MVIDSAEMALSLPRGKLELISKWCQKLLQMKEATIRELSSLLSNLNSTALAIFSAPLQVRYLQRKQIERLVCSKDFQQQSSFGLFMQGGTKLMDNRFKLEQQKVNINCETRICGSIRCLEVGGILPKSVNVGIMVVRREIS